MDIFEMSKTIIYAYFILPKNEKKLVYYKNVGIFYIIKKKIVTILFFIYFLKSI